MRGGERRREGRPCGRERAVRLKQGFAELFEVEPPPHALATEFRISVVIADAARLDERDNGLDEKATTATLPVPNGESRFRRLQPAIVVHAEEKRGIDGGALDRLAQNRRRARLRQKPKAARRFDADDADDRRRGQARAGLQQRSRIDRLVCVEKHDVAIGIEVRSLDMVDAAQRHSEPEQCALKRLGVEIGAGPEQTLSPAKILDEALGRHDATLRTGRMATDPKRDELRIR